MNIEFQPCNPQPVIKEAIIIGGREVGKMELYQKHDHKYRAYIMFSTTKAHTMSFGHGETKEDAIMAALDNGTAAAAAMLLEIDTIRAEMGA